MIDNKIRTGNFTDVKGMILEIPRGWQICIAMTTQAVYSQKVLLSKNNQIIFEHERAGQNPSPMYTAVIPWLFEDDPQLTVETTQSKQIDYRFSEMVLEDGNGDKIAVTYTFMTEDSTDADYNDLLLHITAYRKEG